MHHFNLPNDKLYLFINLLTMFVLPERSLAGHPAVQNFLTRN